MILYKQNENNTKIIWIWLGIAAFLGLLFIVFLAVIPIYSVWEQEMTGKAEYARAEQNRNIAILEATAKKDSATQLAFAEVERAKGVAESNKIISGSITEPYLRYLWIQGLQTNQMQVVYVPTEANLPIMEANRFGEYAKTNTP